MLMQTYEARLNALRAELKRRGLSGFIVPISDEHMSEYVGDYAQRLAWISGFGGSAGMGIVLADRAAIFVDGRYTVQVRDQVEERLFSYEDFGTATVADYLAQNTQDGEVIGYDAWLHSGEWVKAVAKGAEKSGATLQATDGNPIDAVWSDQPARPDAVLTIYPDSNAGETSATKRTRVAAFLAKDGLDATVVTALDSVMWLFNVRGDDVANTPVALSYAIVDSSGMAQLFVAPEKLTDDVRAALGNQVSLSDYAEFPAALAELSGRKVAVDPERAPAAVFEALEKAGALLTRRRDPIVLMKALKNPIEQAGTIAAHERDGIALTRFLKWASEELVKGGHDEMSAAAQLRAFREELGCLKDLSFRTISATGPHGALPHYSVDEDSNIPIKSGHLYLVDSGGQYQDGTTDVTRVVAVGEPSEEMSHRYTQVLKGHIALNRAIFPDGTTGGQLDALARQFLWADGVDYAHGTGHGVGSYLSVHEGPQRIAKSSGPQPGTGEPLRAGMIVSNEPGYYKAGEFGIRIENLELIEERNIAGAEHKMLGFRTLTLAPLEPRLIDEALLSVEERGWINAYHARVLTAIGPHLAAEEAAWLAGQCAPM
jgi:Xaa-Pro aminopeptidase